MTLINYQNTTNQNDESQHNSVKYSNSGIVGDNLAHPVVYRNNYYYSGSKPSEDRDSNWQQIAGIGLGALGTGLGVAAMVNQSKVQRSKLLRRNLHRQQRAQNLGETYTPTASPSYMGEPISVENTRARTDGQWRATQTPNAPSNPSTAGERVYYPDEGIYGAGERSVRRYVATRRNRRPNRD